jgi:hypothetical protein
MPGRTETRSPPRGAPLALLALFGIFSATFIGDFTIAGIPVFFGVVPLIVFLRYALRIKLSWAEVIAAVSSGIFLSLLALLHHNDLEFYYFSFIFILVYLFFLKLTWRPLSSRAVTIFLGLAIIAVGAVAIMNVVNGTLRASHVFGPNVYYRVIGFLAASFLLSNYLTRSFGFPVLFILFGAVIGLAATGSRGAVLVIIFLVALFYRDLFDKSADKSLRLPAALFTASIIIFFYVFIDTFQKYFWRLTYLSLENGSEKVRLSYVNALKDYLENAGFIQLVFGDGYSQRVFSFYPHNIFLEAVVYHGLFFSIPSLIFFGILVTAFRKSPSERTSFDMLVIIQGPIFIGTLISGSLMEAYSIYAISIIYIAGIVSRMKFSDRQEPVASLK